MHVSTILSVHGRLPNTQKILTSVSLALREKNKIADEAERKWNGTSE